MGYCGSALTILSMLMVSVVKLRVINTIDNLIVCQTDDSFLRYFLKRWKEDLKLHFPEFDRKSIQADRVYL